MSTIFGVEINDLCRILSKKYFYNQKILFELCENIKAIPYKVV